MIKAENFRQASHMGFFSAIKFMVLVEFNAYKTSIAQMIRQIFSPILYFIHNWREYPHFDKWGMNCLLKAR